MSQISLITAFIAGVGSFFAPCVIPLLPVYVGYVLGISTNQPKQYLVRSAITYILGFSLIFTLLGAAAGGVGGLIREYTRTVQLIGGVVILFFALEYLGILRINYLLTERKVSLPNWVERVEFLRSFFIGVLFALTWSPCVGPILGGILSLAAASGTAAQGSLLLLLYALGISVPFVVVALTLSSAPAYLRLHKKALILVSKLAGVILLIFGVILITDTYKYLYYVISQL